VDTLETDYLRETRTHDSKKNDKTVSKFLTSFPNLSTYGFLVNKDSHSSRVEKDNFFFHAIYCIILSYVILSLSPEMKIEHIWRLQGSKEKEERQETKESSCQRQKRLNLQTMEHPEDTTL
jgi:hypothetical protein